MSLTNLMQIKSRASNYDVVRCEGITEAFKAMQKGARCFYIADKRFHSLWKKELIYLDDMAGVIIDASEHAKCYEQLTPIFGSLLDAGIRRDSILLVIGGGVVQDIGCFIASVLFRGIRWELLPTTLLGQADSCIGSKSSINIGKYKNQIGTFYPPNRVWIIGEVLSSLAPGEVKSGIGEIIKLHLIAGEEPYSRLIRDLNDGPVDWKKLASWVDSSLRIKKHFIEEDEFDQGIRNLLNYGHTFGHAYESATNYAIPHGIAVTMGIMTATYISWNLGMISKDYYLQLKADLLPWYDGYQQHLHVGLIDQIVCGMARDKKNREGQMSCILTRGAGGMERITMSSATQVVEFMTRYIQTELNPIKL